MRGSVPLRAMGPLSLCLLLPLCVDAASVHISEVLYDAIGADDGRIFVELYGPPGTDLEGFSLEGINGADGRIGPILELSGPIPADGFFVVADRTEAGTFVPDADLLLDFDLQNGPDSVLLRGPAGGVHDALGYGSFGPSEVFAGEGSPAPDAPAGSSLARLLADVDTNDNGRDFRVLAEPTPGWGATQIPEPSGLLLALLGLGGGLLLRRRTASKPRAIEDLRPGPPPRARRAPARRGG